MEIPLSGDFVILGLSLVSRTIVAPTLVSPCPTVEELALPLAPVPSQLWENSALELWPTELKVPSRDTGIRHIEEVPIYEGTWGRSAGERGHHHTVRRSLCKNIFPILLLHIMASSFALQPCVYP